MSVRVFSSGISTQSVDWVKQIVLVSVDITQSFEGQNRGKKKCKKGEYSLFLCLTAWAEHCSSVLRQVLCLWCSRFSELWSQTRIFTTCFPISIVCRKQTVRLSSLHSCVSQFLIINLFLYSQLVPFLGELQYSPLSWYVYGIVILRQPDVWSLLAVYSQLPAFLHQQRSTEVIKLITLPAVLPFRMAYHSLWLLRCFP